MALNLRRFPGDACELEEETGSLLVGPILRTMFSMSTRMWPAELTSAIVPMKLMQEFALGSGVLLHRGRLLLKAHLMNVIRKHFDMTEETKHTVQSISSHYHVHTHSE